MNQIKGIIFDLDGTVINSNTYTLDFLRGVVGRHKMSDAEVFALKKEITGLSVDDMSEIFRERYVSDMTIPEIKHKVYSVSSKIYRNKVGYFDTFHDYHEQISATYPTAIATSLPRELVDIVDESLDLKWYFKDNVLSLTDNPAYTDMNDTSSKSLLFEAAAERMKVNPRNCLVYEDSVIGVLSAKKAGMYPIMVLHGAGNKELLEAAGTMKKYGIDMIVTSFPVKKTKKIDLSGYLMN